jgi:hypothetical protein
MIGPDSTCLCRGSSATSVLLIHPLIVNKEGETIALQFIKSSKVIFVTYAFISLPGFEIQEVSVVGTRLSISAGSTSPTGACPACHQISARLHRYYLRSPADLEVEWTHCSPQSCGSAAFADKTAVRAASQGASGFPRPSRFMPNARNG